jgi:hypothetical protein
LRRPATTRAASSAATATASRRRKRDGCMLAVPAAMVAGSALPKGGALALGTTTRTPLASSQLREPEGRGLQFLRTVSDRW